MGRKNPTKDPDLIGRADYICEANGEVRWTIEAKAPNIDISDDDIYQAFTYANHPEIRAIYFCLTNGHTFKFFQTNRGPDVPAFFEVNYDEINENLIILKNLLSPENILKEHPPQNIDVKEPVGPGLKSMAQIVNGKIHYEYNSLGVPALKDLIIYITGGTILRDENNRLFGYVETLSPYQQLQEVNERLGLTKLESFSTDTTLSTNSEKPTVFESRKKISFTQGERMFNLQNFKYFILPMDLTIETHHVISGYLDNKIFKGQFLGEQIFSGQSNKLKGNFEAFLA